MNTLLAQAIQSVINPLAKPIRTELSNLALRLLVAIVFSTLTVFSGVQAFQALQALIKELVFGHQIEIAAFSTLTLICLGIVVAVLRRAPTPVQKDFDLQLLLIRFLDGVVIGATRKEEAPDKEPLS
jgi:hypothetical protein